MNDEEYIARLEAEIIRERDELTSLRRINAELLAACKEARSALSVAKDDALNIGGRHCEESLAFDKPLAIVSKAIKHAEEPHGSHHGSD